MRSADERKPVTVLFADLVGSTGLATQHNPEHLRALLSAFFDEMRQQIEAFGGTVEKYAGDAVVAVFGVPRVNEDDAERSVRAAVAMHESLVQLNPMFEQQYGVRLELRVGVATGEAVAAADAVNEFMVTGEVANLAARLQSSADGIVISEETHRLLSPLLEAEQLAPLSLKGFPGPVTAFRVMALRQRESRPRGVPGLSSPLVGRDAQLGTLRGCVDELRGGRGQVVSIIGEAGVGKSRLKIEIRDNLPAELRWIEGRCQSYTQSTSYGPVAQILRAALGLGANDPSAIARTKLRAGLRALAGSRGDQAQPALAHLLGIELGAVGVDAGPTDPRSRQSQIVLATRIVLEELAARGPMVLAVEDLHWADAASVELLSVILELTDVLPLMVLVTCRPETEGEAWTFRFDAEKNYPHRLTEIRLGALAPEQIEHLADNLLRVSDLPERLRSQILQRSEGNPLFLEEIIRELIDRGVLHHVGGRWTAATDVERLGIPTTLRGVLAARIDRLAAPAKAALQRASVVGRFFTYRELRALSDPKEDLDRSLAQLLRAELIREWARSPERQYIFKHALTQEAAYASLLAGPRKALHATIARHLEEAGGAEASEKAAVLAHHWYQAEDWDHALDYTLRAADRARALYARPEAIEHHWRALDLLARLPETPTRRRKFVEVVTQLIKIPGWAKNESEHQKGLERLAEATRVAEALGDLAHLVEAEAAHGFVTGGEASLVRAVQRCRDARDIRAEASALDWYIPFLGWRGRFPEALAHTARVIELHGELGNRFQQAFSMTSGGRCWGARAGRLDEALAYARRARELAAELNDARLTAWRAMAAEPYYYMGLWDDIVRVADESLPIAWEIGEHTVITYVSAWLGLAKLKLGHRDEARQLIARGLAYAETRLASVAFALSYAYVARALAHLADGELPAALERARRGLDLAERVRSPLEQGAAHRALGQIHQEIGDRKEAEAAYRHSLELLEAVKALPELGQTLLAYGRFRRGDDRPEAHRLVARARDIFAEIGARGWVAEADTELSAAV
jgi:class 3 adenylate cyclase/tetratricopeptide (TPR) repeat protein